jgi:excinuclease UvrABC nuclease subunit
MRPRMRARRCRASSPNGEPEEAARRARREAFGLPAAPRRIDVFDNSHIMGTNAVGAMIVAGEAGFMKTHYRTFNIRSRI